EAERKHHFTELDACVTRVNAFAPLEKQLGDLLGNRRPAFDDPPLDQVVPSGAKKGDEVDAGMSVEAAILGRERRGDKPGRQMLGVERPEAGTVRRKRFVQ